MTSKVLTKKDKEKLLIEASDLNLEQASIEEQHSSNASRLRELANQIDDVVEAGYYLVNNYEVEVLPNKNTVYCGREYKKL